MRWVGIGRRRPAKLPKGRPWKTPEERAEAKRKRLEYSKLYNREYQKKYRAELAQREKEAHCRRYLESVATPEEKKIVGKTEVRPKFINPGFLRRGY